MAKENEDGLDKLINKEDGRNGMVEKWIRWDLSVDADEFSDNLLELCTLEVHHRL